MSISKDKLKSILDGFKGKRILVIGDLMLDHYIETRVKRLSREHLIPVHKVIDERYSAGGAANVAVNINSLGGNAHLIGVIGNDREGSILRDTLASKGIDADLVVDDRCTPLKDRYHIAGSLYFRADREVTEDVDREVTLRLISSIKNTLNESIDGICVSDYDKGTVTPLLLRSVTALAKERGLILVGQPKIRHYLDFIDFDYIKSTLAESIASTGISIMNESSFHNMGVHLLSRLNCKALLLNSSKGLTIFKHNNMINIPFFIPKEYMSAIGIRDVTLALLVLALTAGADVIEASIISSLVHSTATIRPETMVVTMKDVDHVLTSKDKEIIESISQIPLYK
jgi:rfaE bifunctional protein kinase chain/domain